MNKSNKLNKQNKSTPKKKLSLTYKGMKQAHRNDSTEVWKLLSTGIDLDTCDYSDIDTRQNNFNYYKIHSQRQNKRNYSPRSQQQNPIKKKSVEFINKVKDKNDMMNFQMKIQLNNNKKQQIIQKLQMVQKQNKNRKRVQTAKQNNIIKSQRKSQKKLHNQNNQKKSILNYTAQEMIKKIDPKKLQLIIEEYIKNQKFFSRTLSDTAFAKLFHKPCQATYGYKNCSIQSAQTNNLYKTFNIVPHTKQNNPKTYQSYHTTIQYAKRCKLDDKKQRHKLQLQLAKHINFEEFNKIMKKLENKSMNNQEDIGYDLNRSKSNNNKKSQKLTDKQKQINDYKIVGKSNQKIFDLDEAFNDQYFQKVKQINEYQKSRNPILPKQIKQEEDHIDQIRRGNFQKDQIQGTSAHYLISCVDTPYDKTKYSFRQSRVTQKFSQKA